jgi:hypothetical protein
MLASGGDTHRAAGGKALATFRVTFRDGKGRESKMDIEDVSTTGAKQTALFFENSRGRVIKAEPAK